ncbi:MAG: M1 family metallopeptidase, partial [Myxococcota bacterium]
DFEVQLPEVFARTGFKGVFHMVGQWFPKIGVLVGEAGQETWHCEPFHLNSEFFADFGTYDVTMTLPQTHVVAATGVLTRASDNDDGTRTLVYRAEDVHDFAWMTDPHIEYISGTATVEYGQVEVRIYHRPGQRHFAERHLHAGIGSIEKFSEMYVPYPWPLMSIISPPPPAAGGAGGMEYPTLVTTAGDSVFMRPGMYLPEFVTVHEVGHNWFQGMLASNEVDEAWLDEGVNEYADGLVMEALYGADTSMINWSGLFGNSGQVRQAGVGALSHLPTPIAIRSYEFPDFSSYGAATYTKTALVLRTLENVVGADAFHRAMREYARRFAFRHPTGQDLFATLEEVLGQDLDWYTQPAFYELSDVHHELRDIRCRRLRSQARGVFGRGDERTTVTDDDAPETETRRCEVLISDLGRIRVPFDLRVEFKDGHVQERQVAHDPTRSWHRIAFEHSASIARVTIDPDRKILLDSNLGARDRRTEADSSATRRAAGRIHFWVQTAMQVLGL